MCCIIPSTWSDSPAFTLTAQVIAPIEKWHWSFGWRGWRVEGAGAARSTGFRLQDVALKFFPLGALSREQRKEHWPQQLPRNARFHCNWEGCNSKVWFGSLWKPVLPPAIVCNHCEEPFSGGAVHVFLWYLCIQAWWPWSELAGEGSPKKRLSCSSCPSSWKHSGSLFASHMWIRRFLFCRA